MDALTAGEGLLRG